MRNTCFIILICLALGTPQADADDGMINRMAMKFAPVMNIHDPGSGEMDLSCVWTPEYYAGSEWWDVSFSPAVDFPVGRDDPFIVSVDALLLEFFPLDWLTVGFGKMLDDTSFALFFSKTAFFRAVDYEKLLAGRFEDASTSSWLFHVTGFWKDWYARGTWEPIHEDVPFFEPDSPWFPRLGFPEEVSSPFASDGVLALEEVRVVYDEGELTVADWLNGNGVSLEIGGSVGNFDLLAAAYSGLDTAPQYTATMVLYNLVEDYRIDLRPVKDRVTGLGTALRGVFGPAVLYAEGAYLFDKTFMKETVTSSSAGFETESYESPYLGYTLGGSWDIWVANLFCSAEYTNGHILREEDRTVAPFFQQMALASVLWAPWEGKLQATLAAVYALEDYSGAVTLKVQVSPRDGAFTAGVSMPVFWGSDDSSLGQYADLLAPALQAAIRF